MTLKQAQFEAKSMGGTVRRSGQYDYKARFAPTGETYFTDDLADAVSTLRAMRARYNASLGVKRFQFRKDTSAARVDTVARLVRKAGYFTYIERENGIDYLFSVACFRAIGLCVGTLMDFVLSSVNAPLRISCGLRSHGWQRGDTSFWGNSETHYYTRNNRIAVVTYYADSRPVFQFLTV